MENYIATSTDASSAHDLSIFDSEQKFNLSAFRSDTQHSTPPSIPSFREEAHHKPNDGGSSNNDSHYATETTEKDLVTWDGPEDSENPQNFSNGRKWAIVFAAGFMTFTVSLGSSIFSTVTMVLSLRFGVSDQVMTLGVSLYVLGFAFGPLVWGPMSEAYGRKWPMFGGMFLFLLLTVPIALAENLYAIFICRFLAGAFGSATIAITPGMGYDLFPPKLRGAATVIYTLLVFAGPCAGPVIGSFIMANHSLNWQWTNWIVLILGTASFIIGLYVVKESYEPVLLQRKAARLRLATKNWSLHAKLDEHPMTFESFKDNYILRPLQMTVMEPILVIMTIFTSLVYALLYLSFLSYPYIFVTVRGWRPELGSLPFFAIFVGFIFACVILGVFDKAFYQKRLHQRHGVILPEDRIPPILLGGIILPGGLIWLGWTVHASWPAQVLAGLPIGIGIMLLYMSSIAYLIDVYLINSNSALAVNGFFRSLLAAGFPLFANNLYERLGVGWASTLLAFLFIALIPFPFIFWFYGNRLRAKSKFSFAL